MPRRCSVFPFQALSIDLKFHFFSIFDNFIARECTETSKRRDLTESLRFHSTEAIVHDDGAIADTPAGSTASARPSALAVRQRSIPAGSTGLESRKDRGYLRRNGSAGRRIVLPEFASPARYHERSKRIWSGGRDLPRPRSPKLPKSSEPCPQANGPVLAATQTDGALASEGRDGSVPHCRLATQPCGNTETLQTNGGFQRNVRPPRPWLQPHLERHRSMQLSQPGVTKDHPHSWHSP